MTSAHVVEDSLRTRTVRPEWATLLKVAAAVVESPGNKCLIDPEHRCSRRQLQRMSSFLAEHEENCNGASPFGPMTRVRWIRSEWYSRKDNA